ncbi:MAG TPA: MBL fold metallo-hydrolase [Candidatus Polarisedimenticolia bacterium]|nr:MBL fold metallo-hydrolase [Candidatus Polarisedimenticolia bacterium]
MRPIRRLLCVSICMALGAAQASAHSGAPPGRPAPAFKLEKLTDRVYCLYGEGGNVGFLVTGEGVVVVDDEYAEIAPGIVEQIRSVTDRPILYQINTHYHSDHTGGNPVFAKFSEIIAHDTVRPRLLEYPATVRRSFPGKMQAIETEIAGLKDPADPYRVALEKDLGLMKFLLGEAEKFSPGIAAPPRVTYDGHMNLWLGGQQITIVHVAPGHTDGDSIVFFPNEKVVHMGDLFWNGIIPFIDALAGGSEKGFIDNIDYVLERTTPEARVIPGHGPAADVPTLRRFRAFLVDLRAEVEKSVRKGLSRVEAIRTIRMDQYPDIKPLARSLGNDIAVTYDEVVAGTAKR